MSDFYEMFRHSRRHNDRIKKLCAPLFRYFGFNGFFYHTISNDGYGTSLGSDIPSFEYYFCNELYKSNPFLKHPDHFETSFHLLPEVKNDLYQDAILEEAKKFNLDYKLFILKKSSSGCEGFSFALPYEFANKPRNFLNDLPLLMSFIDYFKQEAQPIFRKVLQDQYAIKNFVGKSFNISSDAIPLLTPYQKKIHYLKEIGMLQPEDDFDLSAREAECLKLLLRGHSASQIALKLNLSTRTVEHYLDHVKVKTNCFTKLELFQKFKALESLNLF